MINGNLKYLKNDAKLDGQWMNLIWKNVILLRICLFYEKIPVFMGLISGTRGIRIKGRTKGGTGHFFQELVFR